MSSSVHVRYEDWQSSAVHCSMNSSGCQLSDSGCQLLDSRSSCFAAVSGSRDEVLMHPYCGQHGYPLFAHCLHMKVTLLLLLMEMLLLLPLQVHDLWHVLFGCGTNVFGELALKALEFVQVSLTPGGSAAQQRVLIWQVRVVQNRAAILPRCSCCCTCHAYRLTGVPVCTTSIMVIGSRCCLVQAHICPLCKKIISTCPVDIACTSHLSDRNL